MMVEEEKKEEKPTEEVVKDGEAAARESVEKDKVVTELDRAVQIAERQKRENDRREKLIEREERLEAMKKIGGQSEAGQPAEKPKEETPKEYKDRIMRGEI